MSFWDIFAFSGDIVLYFVVAICMLFGTATVLVVAKRMRMMDKEEQEAMAKSGVPAGMEQKLQDDF